MVRVERGIGNGSCTKHIWKQSIKKRLVCPFLKYFKPICSIGSHMEATTKNQAGKVRQLASAYKCLSKAHSSLQIVRFRKSTCHISCSVSTLCPATIGKGNFRHLSQQYHQFVKLGVKEFVWSKGTVFFNNDSSTAVERYVVWHCTAGWAGVCHFFVTTVWKKIKSIYIKSMSKIT